MKHTPGPWKVHTYSNGGVAIYETALSESHQTKNMADPAPICIMKSDEREGHNQYANADLIAAAPEMLDALNLALIHMEQDGKLPQGVIVIIDAAIAKARGEK